MGVTLRKLVLTAAAMLSTCSTEVDTSVVFEVESVCRECSAEDTIDCWENSLRFHSELLQKSVDLYVSSLALLFKWRNRTSSAQENESLLNQTTKLSHTSLLSDSDIKDLFQHLLTKVESKENAILNKDFEVGPLKCLKDSKEVSVKWRVLFSLAMFFLIVVGTVLGFYLYCRECHGVNRIYKFPYVVRP